jgi:hypothetical protein
MSNLYAHRKKCIQLNIESDLTKHLVQTDIDNDIDKDMLLQLLLKEREQFQQKEEELQKQVETEKQNVETEKLRNTTNQTYNNTIDTQNNLNIQINAFGCENLEYITDKFKIKCLNQIYKSIPEMVAKIHFNTKYPENHNVKILNKKLPQASIMTKDNKWKTVDKKTTISSIVNKSFGIMEETFEEHKDKLTENKRHNYVKYQDKFNNNDKELHKQIETEVEYMVVDETRR